jgi:hypothetical protein
MRALNSLLPPTAVLVLVLVLVLIGRSAALDSLSCSDLNVAFVDSGCENTCSSATCLYTLPACAAASAGHVCHDGTNVVVKGLDDAFDLSGGAIGLKKSIIPDTHNMYDFGNADFKIRDIFEQN